MTARVSAWCLLVAYSAFLAICVDAVAGVTTFPWLLWCVALAAGFVGVIVNAVDVVFEMVPA